MLYSISEPAGLCELKRKFVDSVHVLCRLVDLNVDTCNWIVLMTVVQYDLYLL